MNIEDFANKIIFGSGGLVDFEERELVGWNKPRDQAIAEWTIKCLSNPDCEGSQIALDAIIERRNRLQKEKIKI